MLPKKVEQILNIQIDKEGYSSHLYLSMACWAENEGLGGVAEWLYMQADEERMHMLKFIKYINERDGQAKIAAVKEPPSDFGSVISDNDTSVDSALVITGDCSGG